MDKSDKIHTNVQKNLFLQMATNLFKTKYHGYEFTVKDLVEDLYLTNDKDDPYYYNFNHTIHKMFDKELLKPFGMFLRKIDLDKDNSFGGKRQALLWRLEYL